MARALADELGTELKQPVVVENRVGANSLLATRHLAQAKPDGLTLMYTISPHVTNALLYTSATFDLFKDFEYVSLVSSTPVVLVAHPDFPANNIQQMLDLARKSTLQPLQYASPGVGSTFQLAMDLISRQTNVQLAHVPYKGAAPAVVDVIAGRIPMMFATVPTVLPHIKDGRLKPLGVATEKRIDILPDVPAIAESMPGFRVDIWEGVLAPAGTPQPILDELNTVIVKTIKSPRYGSWLREHGNTPVGSTRAAFLEQVKTEYAVWSDLIQKIGLRLD